MRHELPLADPQLRARVAALVRESRLLAGWSQQHLADRAQTSQSRVSRLETGGTDDLDLATLGRVLAALGLRGSFGIDDRHLDDRREQHGVVHGIMLGWAEARLRRRGWHTTTEVPIGGAGPPRGWIDLLGFRPADHAGLVGEIKGDIPDVGALQRQVAFYEREAPAVMRTLGWPAARFATVVIALDSATVHAALRVNAQLLGAAFPGSPDEMDTWLREAGGRPPRPTIALVDPASRRERWLLRTPMSGRRSPAGYASYADAAQTLRRPRPPRGPPGSHRRSRRSPPP